MIVEIWSDLICPWCGIGQHRLEQALAAFSERQHVRVVHRSFELDPREPTTPRPTRDLLAKKYRLDDAQVTAMFARVEGIAAADGITPYIVGDNVVANTRLAHELLAFASERGQQHAAWQHLYRAYFGERRSIFELDALVELAGELGLDREEARAALVEHRYRDRVEADAREAKQLGATGVPFIVIDRRYGIAGAQPADAIRQTLEQAWKDQPTPLAITGDGPVCGPDGCAI